MQEQKQQQKQILNAFLVVLRPIIRILLRYGIGYREFLEVVKTAFVDIASTDFGLRGRLTNISRVAVMTGLTRKEVRRLRDKISKGGDMVVVRATPIADVLHHWHAHDEYTDDGGDPKPLPFHGDISSFTSLVKKFGGDIPAGAMRTEMKRVGAVVVNDDDSISITERVYKPSEDHEMLVTMLIHAAYPVLSNIMHNTNPDRSDDTWASRVAYTQQLQSGERVRLRRVARDRITEFAESFDDIFMAYESVSADDSVAEGDDAVAVGVFYFEERDADAKYEW